MKFIDYIPEELLKGDFKIVDRRGDLVADLGELDQVCRLSILLEDKEVGNLYYNPDSLDEDEAKTFVKVLAPSMRELPWLDYNLRIWLWVQEARALHPEIFDWVGVYFRASYLIGEEGTDLILGPYVGEPTDHVRIPLDRGFCGMALREEKVVNVEDVTKSDVHIACSLKTRSELVIPLYEGDKSVAELDIDSNQINAFSQEVEDELKEFAKTFPLP